MITLEQLTEFFADTRAMHAEEKMSWNIDAACLWSYYFLADTREALVPLADHLESLGFSAVSLDESEEDEREFMLQVDKIDTHTPESLFALGAQFEALVEQFSITAYDGMDVCGPDGEAD